MLPLFAIPIRISQPRCSIICIGKKSWRLLLISLNDCTVWMKTCRPRRWGDMRSLNTLSISLSHCLPTPSNSCPQTKAMWMAQFWQSSTLCLLPSAGHHFPVLVCQFEVQFIYIHKHVRCAFLEYTYIYKPLIIIWHSWGANYLPLSYSELYPVAPTGNLRECRLAVVPRQAIRWWVLLCACVCVWVATIVSMLSRWTIIRKKKNGFLGREQRLRNGAHLDCST